METGFLDRVTSGSRWVVYVPYGYKPGAPAILFLHGMGESGTDGLRQTAIGLCNAVRLVPSRWPYLIVCPQKPVASELWPTRKEHINEVLKAVEKEFQPDPHRRYITGLSQGGHGTFMLADKLAWQFAAAAPVCGWMDDPKKDAGAFKQMPLWAFHGDADRAVPSDRSVQAVKSIQDIGGEAKLTVLPGVGHNSWDHAYQESDLPSWFQSQNL